MTLDQLVTDLATSQQLKAAGFPQDTALVWVEMPVGWVNGGGGAPYIAVGGYVNRVQSREITLGTLSERLCAAPTAEEILKELPRQWRNNRGYKGTLHVWHNDTGLWSAGWESLDSVLWSAEGEGNLSLAAAQAYLWWKKEVA